MGRRRLAAGLILRQRVLHDAAYSNGYGEAFFWQGDFSEHAAWRIARALDRSPSLGWYAVRYRQSLAARARIAGGLLLGTAPDVVKKLALLANATTLALWEPQGTHLATLFCSLVGTAYGFLRFISPLWAEDAA